MNYYCENCNHRWQEDNADKCPNCQERFDIRKTMSEEEAKEKGLL